jgi:cytochrome P450
MQMRDYLRGLIATRRDRPRDDLISALVAHRTMPLLLVTDAASRLMLWTAEKYLPWSL